MVTPEFGTLENVGVREAWPNEAHNFTPWLSDNLDRLSEVIGIPLEPEGTEVQVEQFSADIFARNPLNDSSVLIENQLEGSDHTHLGQILTYLAGLEAETVIWVARSFQQAHLSAIRWLNENTNDPFAFFAIQVKVVKIGNSPLVPIFEVRERPSEWDRQIRALSQNKTGEQSELTKSRQEFWAYYSKRYPDDGIPPGRKAANAYHPVKVKNGELRIVQYHAQWGIGIYITGRHREAQEIVVERGQPYVPALIKALGFDPEHPPAIFSEDPDSYYAHTGFKIDPRNPDNWAKATDWLHERLNTYRKVLSGPIEQES